MYNKKYLSKRPFLIITNRYLPAAGSKTQLKDWTEKSGWTVHEEMMVVDRVTANHTSMANVIIDVLEAKVIKNSFVESNDDDTLNHYMTKYKPQLTQAISVWMEIMAKNKVLDELIHPTPDTALPAN